MVLVRSRCPSYPLKWYQYADPTMAPLWRSRRGSITPIRHWLLYADHRLAPMCRSVTLAVKACARACGPCSQARFARP